MVALSACVAKDGTQDTASSTQQDAVHERVDSTAESGTVTELNAGGNDVLPCNHIYSYHSIDTALSLYVDSIQPGSSEKYSQMFLKTEDFNQRAFFDYFGISSEKYWEIYDSGTIENYAGIYGDEFSKVYNPEKWFAADYATNRYFLANDDPAPDTGNVFIRPEGDTVHTDRYFTIHPSLISLVGEDKFEEFKGKFGGTADFNVLKFVEYFNIDKASFTECMDKCGSLYIYNPDYVFGTAEMQKAYFEKQILND